MSCLIIDCRWTADTFVSVSQVFEGKPYYVDVAGNFAPVAASGQELFVTFHSFRVNRLSFVARVVDISHAPAAKLFVNKELAVSGGKVMEPPLFSLDVALPDFDAGLISPDMEPEQWKAKFESAKLSVGEKASLFNPEVQLCHSYCLFI